MQGQRSSVESLPETLEFDHRSSSSTASMEQDLYWGSMLLPQEENHNLPNFLLSPDDTNMSFVNMSTEASSSLNIWSSGGPSSVEHSIDQGNNDETKMELGWPASPLGSGSMEADNILSLEDVGINLNTTQIDEDQSFSFPASSNLNNAPQDPGSNTSGLFSHPYVPSSSGREHGPSSSNPHVGFISGDYDDRPGSSLDGRRLACKRKNIEGLPGQSSASGITNFPASVRTNARAGIYINSPSSYTPGASSSAVQLNPRASTITRGVSQNSYPAASLVRNAESSQRNFRLRINPARQHDIYPPNLSSSRDTTRNSSIWLPNEPSPNLIPFNNQRVEPRPVAANSISQTRPYIPVIPALPRPGSLYPWNGAPNSRHGSSSSSVNSAETLTAIREEIIARNTPRNDISVPPLLALTTEVRNLSQDSANWNVAAPTSIAGTSSVVHPSGGPPLVPHQNSSTQFSRGLAEAVRRTLLASESRGQNSNLLLQRSGQSSASQEVGHQSGPVSHGNPQSHIRSALLLDRQSDGVPLSMRNLSVREGRSRVISEIRNALDLMRRGEALRFEDVIMLDHHAFHGVADLHDRHRDMRLDVDNMSYEELLALEERIGNVSTGLGEETISKCLKQRKHFAIGVRTMVETEPCCICQEEYIEGEDLGALDCGHDFHTPCIKQWLMQKNLCPICKTTALAT